MVGIVTAHLREGDLRIPYWDIDSEKAGPCLLITAALHGNEVQGTEVIRRFRDAALENLVCGRLLLVPFANLPAVRNRRPHIVSGPEMPYSVGQGHNANSTWPGKEDGTDSERITFALRCGVVEEATHNIDFHCWPRVRGTTVLFRKNQPEAKEWARLSAVRFAEPREWKPEIVERPVTPCTLTSWFLDTGRTAICIELSGQYTVVEQEVRRGLRGLLNIAQHLGLIEGEPQGLDKPMIWLDRAQILEVKAPHSGLFGGAGLATSDRVRKGDLLGVLTSDQTLQTTEIHAPASGYLWAYPAHRKDCDVALPSLHPFADEGDTLAVIARPQD